ncbi:glycosyltransferase family 4 protein [Telmatocola sphagniphila]|uniref:Glycosyltransferase family 4 protein n=1 Tax=Telmatocola sphagniphila TaxID=1123043 RepID=A0A8E6B6M6_9BACT|nr:glycosyltransferase family 4 protein [Telmatocola sphagniphila]QVL33075.1 glycosyltransferase family 4 protein [Telmatocola sphagniphila]
MPLNLLHVIQRYPPAWGGSEAYFARLSRWLVERGHSVEVWTTDANDLSAFWNSKASRLPAGESFDGQVSIRRFPIDYWPLRRYLLKGLSLLPMPALKGWVLPVNPISFGMRKEAKITQKKFDAVHASAFPYLFPCLCGLKLARRLGCPFILTPFVHIGPWNDPNNAIRRAYLAKPMVRLLRESDLIFAQTPSEVQAIQQMGVPAEKIRLQGLGVDTTEVTGGNRLQARSRWGAMEDQLVIGHLANLSREKGTLDLLEALRIALEKNPSLVPQVRLVLAGPSMLPNLEKDLKRQPVLTSVVSIVGPLSHVEKRDFFAGIDLFCMPSISDSFGLVYLEAMANGKRCLGYKAGGAGDVLQGTGGEAVEANLGVLSDALFGILTLQESYQQISEEAIERCQREFLWQPKLELVEHEIIELLRSRIRS